MDASWDKNSPQWMTGPPISLAKTLVEVSSGYSHGMEEIQIVAFTTGKNISWICTIHVAVKPFTALNTFTLLLKKKKNNQPSSL